MLDKLNRDAARCVTKFLELPDVACAKRCCKQIYIEYRDLYQLTIGKLTDVSRIGICRNVKAIKMNRNLTRDLEEVFSAFRLDKIIGNDCGVDSGKFPNIKSVEVNQFIPSSFPDAEEVEFCTAYEPIPSTIKRINATVETIGDLEENEVERLIGLTCDLDDAKELEIIKKAPLTSLNLNSDDDIDISCLSHLELKILILRNLKMPDSFNRMPLQELELHTDKMPAITCQTLRKLIIHKAEVDITLINAPIVYLELYGCNRIRLLENLSKLNLVHFVISSRISIKRVIDAISKCKLKTLELLGFKLLKDAQMLSLPSTITRLVVDGGMITGEVLPPDIYDLYISGNITHEGMMNISKLPLRELAFGECGITDDMLYHIRNLELTNLAIRDNPITPVGIKHIANMPLRRLDCKEMDTLELIKALKS